MSNNFNRLIADLGAVKTADGYRCPCPVHGGDRKDAFSLKLDGDRILYHCFAGCSQREIGLWLRARGYIAGESNPGTFQKNNSPVYPQFQGLPLLKTYHYDGGHVARYQSGKDKVVVPFFKLNGRPGYPSKDFVRPLYDPSGSLGKDTLYFVEGEKCVDALCELGIPGITLCGGAKAYNKTNWSQLANKTIYVWPDNDTAGNELAEFLKVELLKHNCKVILAQQPKDATEGYDVADFISAGATKEQVLEQFHGAPQSPAFAIVSVEDILAMDIPARTPICGWVYEKSLNLVVAWRGVGKTMFATSMAYAIATGSDYLKWTETKQKKVLYLDGEMPLSDIKERLELFQNAFGCETQGQLVFANRELNPQLRGLPKLDTVQGREALNEIILRSEAEVCFVDNYSTFVPGDQNDAKTWQPVNDWVMEHRAAGRTMIMVHHANKSGSQRGASAIEDVMDCSVMLKRPELSDDENLPRSALFELCFEKVRTYQDSDKFVAWFEVLLDPAEYAKKGGLKNGGQGSWRWAEAKDFLRQRVLGLSEFGYTAKEIENITGIPQSTVRSWTKNA